MTNEDDNERNRRKRKALLRLGTAKPVCIYCDQDDPRALELHHIAGQAYDGLTAMVCRNHHRILSDMQRDHPVARDEAPDLLETIGRMLLGLADLLELLGPRLKALGAALLAQVRNAGNDSKQ